MKDFRVAAVQMNALLGQVHENLEVHARYMAEAAEAKVDLIVFPEESVCGHRVEAGCNRAAEPVPDGPATRRLIELCRRHNMYASAGLAELAGSTVYNAQVLVGPEGLVGVQRKVHPSGDEYFFYRAGAGFDVFLLPFCRVGINICADNNFPESARVAALKGAEVLLMPHAARCGAAPKNLEEERQRVAAVKDRNRKFGYVRAIDNGLFLVFCNQAGLAGQVSTPSEFSSGGRDVVHAGGVMIFQPDGELLAESRTDRFEPEMVVADLSAEVLLTARGRKCFYLNLRRPAAYGVIADTSV